MAVLGTGIVFALVKRSIPEDPAQLFQQALAAVDKQDVKTIKVAAEKLSAYPEFARKKQLLDGILQLGSSRPLKAISLLNEASEDPEIRTRSLMLLGSAYAQSENLKRSVEIFEGVLAEDSKASDARFRLASLYKDMFAYDVAVPHLDSLIKSEYKLSEVYRMRGDILFDQRKFVEASNDYEAAINADKNNPINSMIAERLLQSLLKINELGRAEAYMTLVDETPIKAFLQAEQFLQSGDLAKMAVSVESLRKTSSYDPRTQVLYGRMKLKEGTAAKAAEGIAGLRESLQFVTRSAELFQVVMELAKLAGNEQLSRAAQQNIEQLQALDNEFVSQLATVSKTMDGYEERLKLASLSREIGLLEFSSRVYKSLLNGYPEKASELSVLEDDLLKALPPLVALPLPVQQPSSSPAEGDSKEPTAAPPAAEGAPAAGAASSAEGR